MRKQIVKYVFNLFYGLLFSIIFQNFPNINFSCQARNLSDLIDRNSDAVRFLRVSILDGDLRRESRIENQDRDRLRRHVHRDLPHRKLWRRQQSQQVRWTILNESLICLNRASVFYNFIYFNLTSQYYKWMKSFLSLFSKRREMGVFLWKCHPGSWVRIMCVTDAPLHIHC